MRGYGPGGFDTTLSSYDDADDLALLQVALRVAQKWQSRSADQLTEATARVTQLQRRVDAVREAILG